MNLVALLYDLINLVNVNGRVRLGIGQTSKLAS